MTTFEEAKELVKPMIKDHTFMVAEWGYENDDYWQVVVGQRKYLVEFDPDYICVDDSMYVVKKTTGEFEERIVMDDFDFMESFRPYGDIPAFFK